MNCASIVKYFLWYYFQPFSIKSSCLLISIEENYSKEKRQALLKHGDGGAGWLSTESSEACGVIYMYVWI